MLTRTTVQTGLETFVESGLPTIHGLRVGLITNPTGIDHQLRSTVDLLAQDARIQLRALFGPEHGIYGNAQAGEKVEGQLDPRTNLPMYSLYGSTRRPSAEMLADLDVLIFDMQDLGTRYSTYIATLAYAQEAAAQHNLAFVVFDRPNPITGKHVAGNILDPQFASFVGYHPLPIRHGLTSGELARLFAAEKGWPEPIVVKMQGWKRQLWFDETDLPWVQTTPNLPTLESHTLYPGTCLVEGITCSEGRGTTRPFEVVGAPEIDAFELARTLNALNLPGVCFRAHYFTPMFSKQAGKLCGGVQVHVYDREQLQPVELGLHMLHTVHALYGGDMVQWIEGKPGRYFVDLLLGSNRPRQQINEGAAVEEIVAVWGEDLQTFGERCRPYLLYNEEG